MVNRIRLTNARNFRLGQLKSDIVTTGKLVERSECFCRVRVDAIGCVLGIRAGIGGFVNNNSKHRFLENEKILN